MLLPIEQLPPGHNSVNQFVVVKGGAAEFIAFVENTFGVHERKTVHTPDTDGTLIHAEIALGNATLMLADSKEDWPFTPAFIQIYVKDAQQALDRAIAQGAELITEVSRFYGGFKLARFKDPFRNIWWVYAPDPDADKAPAKDASSSTDWHDKKPSRVYVTIMDGIRHVADQTRR